LELLVVEAALLLADARDIKRVGSGMIVGLWKTSAGPKSIRAEIAASLWAVVPPYRGAERVDPVQIIIVHERSNAVDATADVIEV